MVRRRCSVLSRGFRTAGARSRDRIRESEGLQGDRDLAMVGCQLTTLDVTRLTETSMFAIQQRARQGEVFDGTERYSTPAQPHLWTCRDDLDTPGWGVALGC